GLHTENGGCALLEWAQGTDTFSPFKYCTDQGESALKRTKFAPARQSKFAAPQEPLLRVWKAGIASV
ncbi:MAG: hypothetical protein WCL08_03285, partial [Verrucomicrobiota bacterium]